MNWTTTTTTTTMTTRRARLCGLLFFSPFPLPPTPLVIRFNLGLLLGLRGVASEQGVEQNRGRNLLFLALYVLANAAFLRGVWFHKTRVEKSQERKYKDAGSSLHIRRGLVLIVMKQTPSFSPWAKEIWPLWGGGWDVDISNTTSNSSPEMVCHAIAYPHIRHPSRSKAFPRNHQWHYPLPLPFSPFWWEVNGKSSVIHIWYCMYNSQWRSGKIHVQMILEYRLILNHKFD